MKYLVLRKRPYSGDDPFTEMVAAGGGHDSRLPYDVYSQELEDRHVGDLRRDPNVDVVPSIYFTLIKPLEVSSADLGPIGARAWGIEAVGAGSSPQNGEGVTVAVLDTGIDKTHQAFSGLAFDGENLKDFTVDEKGVAGSAVDVDGHGTHVAATIFGREVNGTRIGVAPGVKKVLIGKVLGPKGGATEVVLNAIEWALERRADVISMSLGVDYPGLVARLVEESGFPTDIAASRALEAYRSNVRLFDSLAALVAARSRGALLVAASGNESRRRDDPRFTVATGPPAAADGFISIGAVSQNLAVAPFSNTGCLLVAPGVGILSAKLGGGLVSMSGTSMATPHVAGVVALWTQKLFQEGDRPNG